METEWQNILNNYYDGIKSMLPQFITAVFVLIIFIIIGKILYIILGKRIKKRWQDSIVSGFIAEGIKWGFYFLGTIVALNLIGLGGIASGVIAGAGISAIIFGFAFKDIGENFLAGILLAFNRPFEIGNIIEVDGQKGTVKGLDLRTTHIRNVAGKDIYFPNSMLLKSTVINYTKDGNIRLSFFIGIAPECDIHNTRHLILDYIDKSDVILKNPKPNVIVEELGEFTTNLQVLFWVDVLNASTLPDEYLGHTVRSKVIADVKEILDKNDIAMPSQVLEHKMYLDNYIKVDSKS